MEIRELVEELKSAQQRLDKMDEVNGFSGAAYDAWLDRQADEYNDPHVAEITFTGVSYFNVKAKNKDGEIVELKDIPLQVYQTVDVTDEDEYSGRSYTPRWSDIDDKLDDYFRMDELDTFDTFVEELPDEKLLPEDYELVEVIDFAEGHGISDLEIE